MAEKEKNRKRESPSCLASTGAEQNGRCGEHKNREIHPPEILEKKLTKILTVIFCQSKL